jgi:hypothetical protein
VRKQKSPTILTVFILSLFFFSHKFIFILLIVHALSFIVLTLTFLL